MVEKRETGGKEAGDADDNDLLPHDWRSGDDNDTGKSSVPTLVVRCGLVGVLIIVMTTVWCGVVWCSVVWCGMVWCGEVWCDGV